MEREVMNLLIVEDDMLIRSYIKEAIQPLELVDRIDEADSVNEALRHIEKGDHQIIILDLILEKDRDTGPCLARRIRDANRDAVIIVVTGYPEELYRRELLAVPIDDFLIKPFGIEKLREAMVRAQTRYRRRVMLTKCFEERERAFRDALEKLRELEELAREKLNG